MEGMNDSSGSSPRARSTAAQRREWVQRWVHSGLSQRAFALRHRLRLSTLQRWTSQDPARASAPPVVNASPGFAQLQLPALSSGPRWVAEVLRPDGTRLCLAHDVTPVLVRQLLRAC